MLMVLVYLPHEQAAVLAAGTDALDPTSDDSQSVGTASSLLTTPDAVVDPPVFHRLASVECHYWSPSSPLYCHGSPPCPPQQSR